jgi:DNA-binding CsgD family transcriptional regulator
MVGRELERARVDDFVADLDHHTWSLALIGEAGIGKTTLWGHAVDRCLRTGVRVLTARPSEDDRHSAGQGLLDLFDDLGEHEAEVSGLVSSWASDDDVALLDRCRQALELLRILAGAGPVVLAIDDLPATDDVTQRVLRFALRRLVDEPVALLVTARDWHPRTAIRLGSDLACGVELLELQPMGSAELRRVISAAVPGARAAIVTQAVDLAHGNPFFAIELARGRPGSISVPEDSPLAALSRRIADLPRDTLHLAQLLATSGPSPLVVLAAAGDLEHLDAALRAGLDADMFVLEPDFVLRFSHPLLSTVVLAGMNALDRQAAHATLAEAVPDPDARAAHLAQAVIGPETGAAAEVEAAAMRLARRGAPRVAADLLGHSARLTPPADQPALVRRALAEMMQWATAGELPTALQLANGLLRRLKPGRLRAEVITGRVVLDFTDAEQVLRAALDDVGDDSDPAPEHLRGQLLGLLGWLLAIHLGRVREGLEHARSGLEIGRSLGDQVLVAQAASTVSTACLLLGERRDDLIAEAVTLGGAVVSSQLAQWPAVLQGRQQLWDGHLARARANFDTMYHRAVGNGAEFQRPYRLCDMAQAALAAGCLDLAEQHAEEGLEAAGDSGDERAATWLAYPRGLIAAMRGDADGAYQSAERLDWWSARTGERPRQAMARHIRGLLDAARQEWQAGLEQLLAALAVLDDIGYVHPGPIPVLPHAIQLGGLAGLTDQVAALHARLRRQCLDLGSPWADAQLSSATGQLALLRDQPSAFDVLTGARADLARLGYRLDAARTGVFLAAAGLRAGHRRDVLPGIASVLADFTVNRVCGWDVMARELHDRAGGAGDEELTVTEHEIAQQASAGRRNKEIAARLFVSESTVEAHLTRIYRKLGMRSRAELARFLVDRPA